MSKLNRQTLDLQEHEKAVERRIKAWEEANFSRRLWSKDHTLWSDKPVPELTDRLGWLGLPETMRGQLDGMVSFAREIRSDAIRHVVLLGMGGSSLAPEMFQETFGNAKACPELIVLDSTHPEAISAVEGRIDLDSTLFLVSSKSGTTLETLSFFRYFWKKTGGDSGHSFAAITDPGSPLEKLALERDFRRVFNAPPDLGGRYSALTAFGLVPAALIGVDVHELLDRAGMMASSPERENPGLVLGAVLGELALQGRDKVTFMSSPSIESFPTWLEQLIAESTGKHGKGILPVVGEPPAPAGDYGTDRMFVRFSLGGEDSAGLDELEAAAHPTVKIELEDRLALGQEIFRWELAVAAACTILGVNPFDQPDVELSKKLGREVMDKGKKTGEIETFSVEDRKALSKAVRGLLSKPRPGDYVCIQAYLPPGPDTDGALRGLRGAVMEHSGLATVAGYGPRFLHSTGQLHKGGPDRGLFLQLVDEPERDCEVPETNYTFGEIIRAQSAGDYMALRQRGRRVVRVKLGKDPLGGLGLLSELLQA